MASKKITGILLSLALVFSMTACSKSEETTKKSKKEKDEQEEIEDEDEDDEEDNEDEDEDEDEDVTSDEDPDDTEDRQAQYHGCCGCGALLYRVIVLLFFAPVSEPDNNIYGSDGKKLVRKFYCKLTENGANEHGPVPVKKIIDNAVAPFITGIPVIKDEIDRYRNDQCREHRK